MKNVFTTEPNPNRGLSVYVNGEFLGMHSGENMMNASGLFNQRFNLELMVEYMHLEYPDKTLYSDLSHTNNQALLRVQTSKFPITEGILKEHKPIK